MIQKTSPQEILKITTSSRDSDFEWPKKICGNRLAQLYDQNWTERDIKYYSDLQSIDDKYNLYYSNDNNIIIFERKGACCFCVDIHSNASVLLLGFNDLHLVFVKPHNNLVLVHILQCAYDSSDLWLSE